MMVTSCIKGYHLGDTNSWCKMTNFEKATRNTLLWRVPGQSLQSQGRNSRMTEMVDFFPTVVELMGLPAVQKCELIDQPPAVECLQGISYADEFLSIAPEPDITTTAADTAKKYAFSQWPYPPNQTGGLSNVFRMGYSVRSAAGYRWTEYVPYNKYTYSGTWTATPAGDTELYDYNTDPNETTNQAGNPSYAKVVAELMAALRAQYTENP